MKIKKAMKLCKEQGRIWIHRQGGKAWLGDGRSWWELEGLRGVDCEALMRLEDMPKKARDQMEVSDAQPISVSLEDAGPDVPAVESPLLLDWAGCTLMPLFTPDGGLWLADLDSMGPLQDIPERSLCIREGRILVKEGLMLRGSLEPVWLDPRGTLAEELRRLAKRIEK